METPDRPFGYDRVARHGEFLPAQQRIARICDHRQQHICHIVRINLIPGKKQLMGATQRIAPCCRNHRIQRWQGIETFTMRFAARAMNDTYAI